MSTSERRVEPIAGHFVVNEIHFSYAERDGKFDLWSTSGDIGVPDLAAASRKLRELHPAKPSSIRVRTVPAPYQALNEPMTWDDLREIFDQTLKDALRVLGHDVSRVDTGGMPSEYRGWMATAREHAQDFLNEQDATYSSLAELAYEIVTATSAVSFSMRYGSTTLPFAMAVALAAIRDQLRFAQNRY